jgi:hypothetical protein
MQSADQRVQQSYAAFEEVSAGLLGLQAEVQGIVAEVLRIDIRVPELESQKKAAVAAKKFKEAGLFSSESKDLLTRKEELLARKEQLIAEEGAKKQEVVRLEAVQADMCVEREKLLKAHDTQRLQRLIRRHKLRAGAQARAIASEDYAAADSMQKECTHLAEEIRIISQKLGVPMVNLQEHLLVQNPPVLPPSGEAAQAELVFPSVESSSGHQAAAALEELTDAADFLEQPSVQVEAAGGDEFEGLSTSDAAAKLQALKEMFSKLGDQLDQLVSQEKFEDAEELNRQLDDVRRQINALEAEMQSHGLTLFRSESGSQTGAAVQWEQDHQSEKSGTSGFGRTFFSDSVPGDGRTIRSFCSGASTGSNDEDDRSKDGAGTVYTIGSLYSQAQAEGGGEDAGKSRVAWRVFVLSFSCDSYCAASPGSMWERTSATESRGGRESQGGDNDQEAGYLDQGFTVIFIL